LHVCTIDALQVYQVQSVLGIAIKDR